jgi:hypothetical protein
MNVELKLFIASWLRVAAAALAPVIATAFVSIPYSLGGHPGEQVVRNIEPGLHLT